MTIHKLSEDLSVRPQVQPEEVPAIAAQGFRSIVCNRPDDEEPGQPEFGEIAAAAQANGLEARHIPVGGDISVADQRDAFAAAMEELPKPVLAYCRTGNRSAQLFEAACGC